MTISTINHDTDVVCSMTMNQDVLASELSLLMVEASLTRPDGAPMCLSNPEISGTTFMYTAWLSSNFDTGNYTCTTRVTPAPDSTYLTGISELSDTLRISKENIIKQVTNKLTNTERTTTGSEFMPNTYPLICLMNQFTRYSAA